MHLLKFRHFPAYLIRAVSSESRARGYKTFFMHNSAENEISAAYKNDIPAI